MFRECRHTMPTGCHCKSPAMRRSVYCYFHDRLHRRFHSAPPARKPLRLPSLDNRAAIRAGLTDVMNAILAHKVDSRQAGRLIYGMQIAATTLDSREQAQAQLLPRLAGQNPGQNSGTRPQPTDPENL